MKFLYKYKKLILPITFSAIACITTPVAIIGTKQSNGSPTIINNQESATSIMPSATNPGDVIWTGVKVGKEVLDVNKIDDEYPYLIDYANPRYKTSKCELIKNYINKHHDDLFYNTPLLWDDSKTVVDFTINADWSIVARVYFRGYDNTGTLSDNCNADFRLWFKQPATDQIFFAVRNLLNGLADRWPEWTNEFQTIFFDRIKGHTLAVVRNNPNSFPQTYQERLNSPSQQNNVYKIDKSKVTLASDFLEIKSDAISLDSGVVLEYEGKPKRLELFVSSEIRITPLKEQTFFQKNGWISIVLPSIGGGFLAVAVIIIIIWYCTRKPPYDPEWGFY